MIDETALPTEPAAGEDELARAGAGGRQPGGFQGLRFKLTGEGAGADVAAFKAGGATPRFPRPSSPPDRWTLLPSPALLELNSRATASATDPPPSFLLLKSAGKKYRLVEEDANVASGMFVLPPIKPPGELEGEGGGAEFGAALPLTRRLTLTRRWRASAVGRGRRRPAEATEERPRGEEGRTEEGQGRQGGEEREEGEEMSEWGRARGEAAGRDVGCAFSVSRLSRLVSFTRRRLS